MVIFVFMVDTKLEMVDMGDFRVVCKVGIPDVVSYMDCNGTYVLCLCKQTGTLLVWCFLFGLC